MNKLLANPLVRLLATRLIARAIAYAGTLGLGIAAQLGPAEQGAAVAGVMATLEGLAHQQRRRDRRRKDKPAPTPLIDVAGVGAMPPLSGPPGHVGMPADPANLTDASRTGPRTLGGGSGRNIV